MAPTSHRLWTVHEECPITVPHITQMCSEYSPDNAFTHRVPLREVGGSGWRSGVLIGFLPITSAYGKLLLGEILFLMLHWRNILLYYEREPLNSIYFTHNPRR